jgi:hypothetical protein
MTPDMIILTGLLAFNGPHFDLTPGPAPDSPLKVWDGSQWVSTGVTVTE